MGKERLIVGITGASGAVLGIRLLQALRAAPFETHLIVTSSARLTIHQETAWKIEDVLALSDAHYHPGDMSAPLASGSFAARGMVVIPCSIKSLSSIANSYSGDLLTRAADVTLKEGRPLVLVVREAPLHAGHIRLMANAAQAGAVILPPVPAFYTHPQSVDDIVDNIVGRVLTRLGVQNDLYQQWQGPDSPPERAAASVEDLWQQPAMTLATSDPGGLPYAAPVFFAADEARQNLFFFNDPGSRHSRNLIANPRCAAALHPSFEDGMEMRGLQISGTAVPVPPGKDWQRAWSCYLVKFPSAGDREDAYTRSILYTLRPDAVSPLGDRQEDHPTPEWNQQ